MIRSLRKKHLIIWLIIPFIVLPLVYWSEVNKPQFPIEEFTFTDEVDAFPTIISEWENADIKVNIRENKAQEKQIELIVKQAINSPFCLVYLSLNDKRKHLLGDIKQSGIYRFKLPFGLAYDGLILYDHIKKTELNHLKIK